MRTLHANVRIILQLAWLALVLFSQTVPASAEDLDVIMAAGQSNLIFHGVGTPAQSPLPIPGTVLKYWDGRLDDLQQDGSALPAFGTTYWAVAHRKLLLVLTAIGASGQCAAADTGAGNWDVTGALVPQALSLLSAGLEAATRAGYVPHFLGTWWSQGENDAEYLDYHRNTYSKDTYKGCFYNMIARIQTAYPGSFFWISRAGVSNHGDWPSLKAIRDGQEEMAAAYHDSAPGAAISRVRIVFRGASGFTPANGMMQPDSVHYTQKGYNLMGRESALGVLKDTFPNSEQ